MTDLEMTLLCAAAMGFNVRGNALAPPSPGAGAVRVSVGKKAPHWYSPLTNDAQAMALVKRLHLQIGKTLRTPEEPYGLWVVSRTSKSDATNSDLNRAIVECVARMQAAKVTS